MPFMPGVREVGAYCHEIAEGLFTFGVRGTKFGVRGTKRATDRVASNEASLTGWPWGAW
jgi:hypothetical protein